MLDADFVVRASDVCSINVGYEIGFSSFELLAIDVLPFVSMVA